MPPPARSVGSHALPVPPAGRHGEKCPLACVSTPAEYFVQHGHIVTATERAARFKAAQDLYMIGEARGWMPAAPAERDQTSRVTSTLPARPSGPGNYFAKRKVCRLGPRTGSAFVFFFKLYTPFTTPKRATTIEGRWYKSPRGPAGGPRSRTTVVSAPLPYLDGARVVVCVSTGDR